MMHGPDPLRPTGLLLAGLLTLSTLAQAPVWWAPVDPIDRPGLHRITLDPALVGRATDDLHDLRIWDAADREVPYQVQVAPRQQGTTAFIPYTVLANNSVGKHTVVELEVPPGDTLSELVLRVRNADVDKALRITGSDDRQRWYMVKDAHLAIRGRNTEHAELLIDLPRSDRRYLRLELNDSLTAAVQITSAGRYSRGSREGRLLRDTGFAYTRQDSAGITTLSVRADRYHVLDRLQFLVSDTLPYRRNAELVTWEERSHGRGRKRKTERNENLQVRFTISAENGGVVQLQGLRVDSFAIRIYNGDDRPLALNDVQAFQQARAVEAFLDPAQQYRLVGLADARAPRYDASPFNGNAVVVGNIGHGPVTVAERNTTAPLFDPAGRWIWAVVLLLAVGMGYMAMRMLRKPAGK